MEASKHLLVLRAIIENKNNSLLLVKRSMDRSYNPGKWELPGGKVAPGQSLGDALDRIVHEELGVITQGALNRHYVIDKLVTDGKYKGFTYVEVATPAYYAGGVPKVGSVDLVSYDWVPMGKVLDYDLSFESKKNLVKYLADVNASSSKTANVILVSRALISNDKGEFLLIKRASTERYPDKWEIPGGKLDSFESLEANLVREVLEETGLLIENIYPNIHSYVKVGNQGEQKGITFVNIMSVAKAKTQKIRLGPDHSEYKWLRPNEILNLPLVDYVKLPLTEVLYKLNANS